MKVCMIFTEGPHDVAFVRRVLTVCCNAAENGKIKLNEFPEPLSSVFQRYILNRDMQDLSLDMAQKFFLPDRVFEKDGCFIMLFSTGGKDNACQVKSFISDLEFTLRYKPDVTFNFDEKRFVFINDADDKPVETVINDMKNRYFPIVDPDTDEVYLTEKDAEYYVWHGENGKGTLEDTLIKLLRSSDADLQAESESFVRESFINLQTSSNVATLAKQYKAILTCAGQGQAPGLSLNSILIRGKLIKDDVLNANDDVKAFAEFLNSCIS